MCIFQLVSIVLSFHTTTQMILSLAVFPIFFDWLTSTSALSFPNIGSGIPQLENFLHHLDLQLDLNSLLGKTLQFIYPSFKF